MRSSAFARVPLPAFALLALLPACSDGLTNTDGFIPLVVPIYSPSTSVIPVPNDLLFFETADLTLNIPVEDPSDASDPPVAMNTQDGWSLGAPFTIAFSGPINLGSAVAGSTVRIFIVSTDQSAAPIGGLVTGVTGELAASDFQVALAGWDATGATLEIRPTLPLTPRTTYMVVLTDGITSAAGTAITTDAEYTIASSQPLLPPDHPMFSLQVLVLSLEAAAEGAGMDRDSIAVAFHFTTQSLGTTLGVLSSVASLGAVAEQGVIDALCASGLVDCSSGTTPEIGAASISGATATGLDTSALGGAGAADFYTASLTLPYFLTAASNTTASGPSYDPAPVSQPWTARYPFVGGTEANLTFYNPLPHPSGTEMVPVLITVPKFGSKPAAGWPVIIFQHGITANRLSVAGIADTVGLGGRVAIAIDLPLHGLGTTDPFFSGYMDGTTRERTFGLDLMDETTGAPGPDGTIDSSGAHMINLANLALARDNLRQGVSDLLHLNSVLGDLDLDGDLAPDLDLSKVTFIGHSLGGMVGVPFLATAPAPLPSTLGMPGGGIAKLLNASLTFGPVLQAGLAGAGVLAGTADYDAFLWAAQTMVDTVDPINHIGAVAARATPIHLIEVVGGGLSGVPDAVVPNSVADAPLAGTEPLIAIGGLASWTKAMVDAGGGQIGDGTTVLQGAVRFIEGTHASLVSPGATVDEAAAFAEMTWEAFTFGLNAGTVLLSQDSSVIQ